MSDVSNLFPPITCEIVDSFVRYTKLKGTKGNGESWLYIGPDDNQIKYKTFFSNFRKDNKYFFLKTNFIKYLENAEHEYNIQKNFHHKKKDIKGYRNNIKEKYNSFKNKINTLNEIIYFKNLAFRIDGGRFYIQPEKTNNNHPWNIVRDFALPQISLFKITKIRMPENYNFKFELRFDEKKLDFLGSNSEILINFSLKDLEKRYLKDSLEYETIIKARHGQGFFKDEILKRMDRCIVTGSKEIVEACHIKPWVFSNDSEKIDGYNGILLTPNCHKLFDRGLITFDNKGCLIKSKKLDLNVFKKLIFEDKKIDKSPILNEKTLNYLKWHRINFKSNF